MHVSPALSPPFSLHQDRLVAMVAERLLDSNTASLEGGSSIPGTGLSEEQRASLAQNLSDAIGLLPKLCTGIDVNLRFHDIAGFEYTQETVSCRAAPSHAMQPASLLVCVGAGTGVGVATGCRHAGWSRAHACAWAAPCAVRPA